MDFFQIDFIFIHSFIPHSFTALKRVGYTLICNFDYFNYEQHIYFHIYHSVFTTIVTAAFLAFPVAEKSKVGGLGRPRGGVRRQGRYPRATEPADADVRAPEDRRGDASRGDGRRGRTGSGGCRVRPPSGSCGGSPGGGRGGAAGERRAAGSAGEVGPQPRGVGEEAAPRFPAPCFPAGAPAPRGWRWGCREVVRGDLHRPSRGALRCGLRPQVGRRRCGGPPAAPGPARP